MYPSPAVSDNTYHIHSDYATDYEPRKFQQQQQHHQKLDTLNNAFRPNLNSYLSTARHRHQPNRSGFPPNQYRDTAPFYPASPPSEGFPPSMTSPVQPQMQSFEPRPNFDFGGPTSNGISGGPNPFSDGYNSTPMHQLHHLNGTKSQSAQQTPQTTYSIPYSNGPQISSQTPYGPHILSPTAAPPGTTATVSSIPPPGQPAAHSVASAHISSGQTNTEEISTIFVVGFPEDMQEREFQNMFTFSVDFEAATLKIPNKEYTAYGNVAGGVSGGPAGLRNGVTGYPTYAGPNDPYNLVTVNQGGVVVDTGREGTLTSWPAVPGEDASGGHFISGGTGAGMNIPRKQIIGFAKFKTREAALIARDGLQGRRVDIDKGAVLKAEMAKKNLHTKRGVGPVSGGTAGPTNGAGSGSVSTAGGIHPTFPNSAPTNALPYSTSNNDSLGAREREIGTLGAMGLGGRLNQWRDQIHQQQQQQDYPQPNGPNGVSLGERAEDDRRANLMNAMGLTSLGSITRGPRERAEDDERERRRKEKDAMRLRAGNTSAYEAFHSVPAGITRHTPSGAGLLSEGDTGSIGLFVSNGGTAGPWDDAKTRLTRPRSPSRSASPSKGNSPFSDFPSQTFSPPVEVPNFQFFAHVRNDQPAREPFSTEPGPTRGHQSHASGVASGGDVPNTDTELVRALDGLDMNSEAGKTSPELPSPASGASSRNGIDQNPPINTLYVGNLPTSSSVHGLPQDHLEANLRELFQNQSGYRRLCFRQKPNGPMCFVEFEDVPHATKALNDLYGNNLKGLVKGGIRLSYSKNPLGVRTPTSSGSNGPTLQQQQLQNSNNNFLNSYPVPFPPDLQPRFSDEPQSRTMPLTGRRDMSVSTSPMPASQPFMTDFTAASSPPPRFFSTSPSGFPPSTSSAPLTGSANAFIPRYGYNNLPASSGSQPSSTFSPFGLSSTPPPHPTIPDLQTTSGDHLSLHTQHTVQNNFAPANNLEAARAGREGSI